MTGRRIDSRGYFSVFKNGKYFKEHRILWEEYNNACLLHWGHIHHKNGNKLDNRIANLEALTKAQHSKIHFDPLVGKGKHYHWKADDPRRVMTKEHKRNISKALLGKPKSEEHRRSIVRNHWASKGRVPWNKGKRLDKPPWNKGKKGVQVAWNKGKKLKP